MLSHLAWLTIFLASEEAPQKQAPLKIERDHQILRLPVFNFAALPSMDQKEKVSLFHEGKGLVVTGFLRSLEEDPMGPTGSIGVVEVATKDLSKFKSNKGPWQVFPLFEERKMKIRGPYEINF